MHYVLPMCANCVLICYLQPLQANLHCVFVVISKTWQIHTAKEKSSVPALPSLSRTKREPSPPLVMRTLCVQKCDILGFTLAEHYIVLAGISDRNPTRQTCPLWLMCCCYCTGVAELCEPFSWQSVREGAHFSHAQLTIL